MFAIQIPTVLFYIFQIEFEQTRTVSELQLMFQGGFAGKNCRIEVAKPDGTGFQNHQDFYPEDSNKLQSFAINPVSCTGIKIIFGESTDFYGRITVYQLMLK